MIFAVAAIALVACSKEFDTNKTASTGAAIGFNTWAETLTKAINDPRTAGTNTFGVGDSFAVYGYKSASNDSGKATVFDAGEGKDVQVEMTVAGTPGTWIYSPLRYWDQGYDKYTFFAVSPSSVGTAATVTPQTGAITSASIVFAGNDNDILVADKETVFKAAYGNQVQLDFNHVASLVNFKVSKAPNLADATVKVTGFTLGNIETTGVMTVSDAYNATVYGGTAGPVVTWSGTATGSYVPANGVTPVKGDDTNDISADHPLTIVVNDAFNPASPAEPAEAKATTLINTLVVKPQTFNAPTNRATPADAANATAQKLTISYTVAVTNGDTNTYESTLWLADFDKVNDADQEDTKVGSWETGKKYTFYITLDSNPIVLGVATIRDWVAGDPGYHYLLN